MTDTRASLALDAILARVEIPESAYEAAEKRYADVATWLTRPDASTAAHSPHLQPQGSFRLGTVIRPLGDRGEYDLDLGCRLREGMTKDSHSQYQVKNLIGKELHAYRTARSIKSPLEEKHRCWRLNYADALTFHMDLVPLIPESQVVRGALLEMITRGGVSSPLATQVAGLAGCLTDDRHPKYRTITNDWRSTNPEGYALWFESRVRLAGQYLLERAQVGKVARIDQLPASRWRAPLQRAVQLLKRHRDTMFQGSRERAPISIILTTLAARAYDGANSLDGAVKGILAGMAAQVRPSSPRVPNPVNPAEDFADKWHDPQLRHLKLEDAFWEWLERARKDLEVILVDAPPARIVEIATTRFSSPVTAEQIQKGGALLAPAATPSGLGFPPKPVIPSKPAGFAES